MSDWLDPLWATLDAAPRPVSFFFRNDDAGWKDERLFDLLYTFSRHSVPIDVAVIPSALSANLATGLSRLLEIDGELLSLHQHGYAHLNHLMTLGYSYEKRDSNDLEKEFASNVFGATFTFDWWK